MYKQHKKADIQETKEIDLVRIGRSLLKRIWMIVIVSVLAAVVTYGYSALFITPMYRTAFTAYINNRLNTDTPSGTSQTTSTSDLTASMGLAYVYDEIITSRGVLTDAAKKCGITTGRNALSSMVSTEISEGAPVVTVYVTASDPEVAAKFATAISEVAPQHVARVIEGSSMNIIDSPEKPTGKFSPNNKRNALIGFAIGLVLAAAVAILMDLVSGKVQDAKELENRCDVPVIGMIPDILSAEKTGYYYVYEKRGKE